MRKRPLKFLVTILAGSLFAFGGIAAPSSAAAMPGGGLTPAQVCQQLQTDAQERACAEQIVGITITEKQATCLAAAGISGAAIAAGTYLSGGTATAIVAQASTGALAGCFTSLL